MALIRTVGGGKSIDDMRIAASTTASATGERTSDTYTHVLTKSVEYIMVACAYSLQRSYSVVSGAGVTNISGNLTDGYGGSILVKLEGNVGDSKTITVTHESGNPYVVFSEVTI